MPNPEITFDKEWFIKLSKRLGYISNEGGMCFGLAHAGKDAFLANSSDQTSPTISGIEHFNRFWLELSKYKIKEIQSIVKKPYAERSEKEQHLFINLIAYLDAIELYMHAFRYGELFRENESEENIGAKPITQTDKVAHQLLNNDNYNRVIDSFTGLYSKKELIIYLEKLKEQIQINGDEDSDLAIVFSGVSHALTVGYDSKKSRWCVIDMPVEYYTDEGKLSTFLIDELEAEGAKHQSKESTESHVSIHSKIYVKTNQQAKMKSHVDAWRECESMVNINQVTEQKARFKDAMGNSWLGLAISKGDLIEELLDNNKDIKLKNGSNEFSPLTLAVLSENIDAAKAIMARKGFNIYEKLVDFNRSNISISSNYHLSAVCGSPDFTAIFDQDAWFLKDDNDNTPLHLAAVCGKFHFLKKALTEMPHEQAAQLLFEKNISGNTLLHMAAASGGSEQFNWLLDFAGENFHLDEIKNSKGFTPIELAKIGANVELLSSLPESMKKKNPINGDDMEILNLFDAMKNDNRLKATSILSENKNKKIATKTLGDYGLLECACEYESLDCIDLLLSRKTAENEFHQQFGKALNIACKKDNISLVKRLLPYCSKNDLLWVDSAQQTALHHASFNSSQTIITMLIKKAKKLKLTPTTLINKQDIWGDTALHNVIRENNETAAWFLLEQGASPMLHNKEGKACIEWENGHLQTLLHRAVLEHRDKVLLHLIENSEQDISDWLNRKDDKGNTVLHYACERSFNENIIAILLEKGADLTLKNDKDESPFTLAANSGFAKGLDMLFEHASFLPNDFGSDFYNTFSRETVEVLLKHNVKIPPDINYAYRKFIDDVDKKISNDAEEGKKEEKVNLLINNKVKFTQELDDGQNTLDSIEENRQDISPENEKVSKLKNSLVNKRDRAKDNGFIELAEHLGAQISELEALVNEPAEGKRTKNGFKSSLDNLIDQNKLIITNIKKPMVEKVLVKLYSLEKKQKKMEVEKHTDAALELKNMILSIKKDCSLFIVGNSSEKHFLNNISETLNLRKDSALLCPRGTFSKVVFQLSKLSNHIIPEIEQETTKIVRDLKKIIQEMKSNSNHSVNLDAEDPSTKGTSYKN